MDMQTVFTSAAVGALVAGIIQFTGQVLERRWRRRELLLRLSLESAEAMNANMMRVADASAIDVDIRDRVYLAADYYPVLRHLLDSGELPKWAKERRTSN
jgi:hypothetical protein